MPSCAISNCKNNSNKKNKENGGVTYHRFPKDGTLKEKWLNLTGNKDWFPTKLSTVCSNHFLGSDFIHKSGRRFLKTGAVPSVEVWYYNEMVPSSSQPHSSFDSRQPALVGENVNNDMPGCSVSTGNQNLILIYTGDPNEHGSATMGDRTEGQVGDTVIKTEPMTYEVEVKQELIEVGPTELQPWSAPWPHQPVPEVRDIVIKEEVMMEVEKGLPKSELTCPKPQLSEKPQRCPQCHAVPSNMDSEVLMEAIRTRDEKLKIVQKQRNELRRYVNKLKKRNANLKAVIRDLKKQLVEKTERKERKVGKHSKTQDFSDSLIVGP